MNYVHALSLDVKNGQNLTAIWQLNTLYLVTGYAFNVNQAYQRA